MIATSQRWKDYSKDVGLFHIKATMTGDSTMDLTDSDFMMGSVSFTDSMSGMSEIKLGAVVTNTFKATLNNFDGKFDDWEWDTISVKVGIIYEDETEEWIDRGTYSIDEPIATGYTIPIECWDGMDKMNKDFTTFVQSESFPISLFDFLVDMCTYCDVDFGDSDFYYTLGSFPQYEKPATCRDALSWLCEVNGAYARMNNYGALDIRYWSVGTQGGESGVENPDGGSLIWDDTNLFVSGGTGWVQDDGTIGSAGIPGGGHSDYIAVQSGNSYIFNTNPVGNSIYFYNNGKVFQSKESIPPFSNAYTPTSSGYIMFNGLADQNFVVHRFYNGGTIDPWNSGIAMNGGVFLTGNSGEELSKAKSQKLGIRDIEITGIRVWVYDPDNPSDHDQWTEWGTSGYMLPVIDNPFMTYDDYEAYGADLWNTLQGFKVRPFQSTIWGDPSMESGDTVILHDARTDSYYKSVISNMTFNLNGSTNVSFDALSPRELLNELESYG